MLVDSSSLALFAAGAVILLVIPGPAVTYIVSRSVAHGRAAGLVSVMGISVGTLCHVLAATLGLSALLVSSARAFQAVKYLGAAYLVYLGIRTLRREDHYLSQSGAKESRLVRIFGEGVLVNVLNPKTALFFLAFLPQFVNPSRGHTTTQILELGILFVLMSCASDSIYALLADSVAERTRGNARLQRMQRKLSGATLIALGLTCAFSGAKSK
jgi:threonine/homoserine/homoserine lactone efflux protein